MHESYPHFAHATLAEPLSTHTTFGIGGPADVFVVPETADELAACVSTCKDAGVDFFVLGKGSDLLVADDGYRGVIVSLDGLTGIEREGNALVCGAGAALKDVAERACEEGLSGFEFACGIPGSIGGACFMNAGAYDGCMADVLESVEVLTEGGDVISLGVEDLELGYEEKQPLEYGSAGSTFKRPEGYFAGKLIMDAGLKGYRVGGAAVSTKHAGFVVNMGGATAADVRAVIAHVQDEVARQFGVRLEPEVRFLGFDE